MIQDLQAKGPTFVVDAGSLFWKDDHLAPGLLPQQQEKARLQAEAFALVGIDAMLPTANDLSLGLPFVTELAAAHQLPYVATDLRCEGRAPFADHRDVERGGITVRVVGLVGPLSPGACTREPAEAALKQALAGGEPDVVVLLSGDNVADATKVARAVGGVDFLVVADRKQLTSPELLDGGGLRLGAGSRGKHLGALSFSLIPGHQGWRDDSAVKLLAEERDRSAEKLQKYRAEVARAQHDPTIDDKATQRAMRQVEFHGKKVAELDAQLANATRHVGNANPVQNELYDLDDRVADHAATQKLVDAAKARIAAAGPAADPTASYAFVGSATCAACHPAEHAQWQGTPHAKAWATLVKENRHLDQDCFSCHATGAAHAQGPLTPAAVVAGGLTDVGCESCHGPGKAHIGAPANVSMVRPTEATCTGCHDGVKDEGRFDYATYLPKVVHR